MRVLQIANGYCDSSLYPLLFKKLEDVGVTNSVFVPVRRGTDVPPNENADIVPCFSQLDRLTFFSKQRKILQEIQTRSYITNSGINVIHAHTLFSAGYAAWRLHKKYGIPYIVAVRNTDVNVFFKRMIHLRRTGICIMRDAYRVVFLSSIYRERVVNDYVPTALQQEIREKSLVIPNGIDGFFLENRPDARKEINNKPIILLYAGDIEPNKNLELTVQAAKLLREQEMDVSITAVGKILDEKYSKLIQETPFVTHFPRCPKEEIVEHLRRSDIFVMPSHTETFGLVYAEAMSQGVPVLYTRGQGFDGQFPDGTVGYAVSDTDPDELAEKIRLVVDRYAELSEACVANAARFNWTEIAETYREIYQNAMKKEG